MTEDDGRVGSSLARWHAEELTLGLHEYVDDMTRPGLLHGAVVLSEHARALVRAIDTAAATKAPGVVRVLTAVDVPGDRWYGLLMGDWPGFVAVDSIILFRHGVPHASRSCSPIRRLRATIHAES